MGRTSLKVLLMSPEFKLPPCMSNTFLVSLLKEDTDFDHAGSLFICWRKASSVLWDADDADSPVGNAGMKSSQEPC